MKAKKQLNFFDKFILCISFILGAAILLSYLAPVVNPKIFWYIAFFGLAYPYLLLSNLLMLVYWLFRKSKWMALPLICIGVGWGVLNKNIGLRLSQTYNVTTDSNRVRVMTYNVHSFKRYGSKNDIYTKHEIFEIIKAEQPDVLCFQEFYTRLRGQYDMVDSIQNILKTNGYYYNAFEANRDESAGLAIFSKLPVGGHGFIKLSDGKNDNQCIYVDLKKGPKTLRVYTVHLQSIRFDPEDYRYLENLSGKNKPEAGSAKRLGYKLKVAFQKRSEQVFKVKSHADSCKYPYVIAGDFNDTPTSFVVNQMSKGLKNAFVEKGSGLGRTYNGSFPNFQIDYIMATEHFDVKSYNVIEKKLSDHYPVCSDLVLK